MFKVGTEFRYKVSRTVDDRPDGIPFEETYRILSVDGNSVRVEVSSDIEETQIIETDTSYGSYIFRTEGFACNSKSPVQIELEGCLVYVDVMVPPQRCGGGETIYLGRDGIVYKDERMQMWSRGVIFRETRKLISISVNGIAYEDIKWVDDGESSDCVE